jgi:hypothetical protein
LESATVSLLKGHLRRYSGLFNGRFPKAVQKDQLFSEDPSGSDDFMDAQRDLVEIVHTLRQVVCVKG